MLNNNGHIYLLREREFIRLDEHTYKIGKTTQSIRRFRGYPKDSHLLIMVETEYVDEMEVVLLQLFKSKFKHKSEYGAEYFYGDPHEMKRLIYERCCCGFTGKSEEVALVEESEDSEESTGIISWLMESLYIKSPKKAPDNIDKAIEIFLHKVVKKSPKWYVPGQYIPGKRLQEEFSKITKFNAKLSELSKKLNGRFFDNKCRKRINGSTTTVYKMIKID